MSGQLQIPKSDIQAEMGAIERIFEALPAEDTDLADIKAAKGIIHSRGSKRNEASRTDNTG